MFPLFDVFHFSLFPFFLVSFSSFFFYFLFSHFSLLFFSFLNRSLLLRVLMGEATRAVRPGWNRKSSPESKIIIIKIRVL